MFDQRRSHRMNDRKKQNEIPPWAPNSRKWPGILYICSRYVSIFLSFEEVSPYFQDRVYTFRICVFNLPLVGNSNFRIQKMTASSVFWTSTNILVKGFAIQKNAPNENITAVFF